MTSNVVPSAQGATATPEELVGTGRPNATYWKWAFVAAMAGFLDAGSIVAGGVGVTQWTTEFALGSTFVGLLGAFSGNAISAGVGALIGGWICDKYGRKKIYAYDLLVYMAGVLVIILAANPAMLFVGFIVTGLAVGADIPASWSLVTEISPKRKRGRLGSLSQVLWYMGPVVVLLLGLALSSLGLLGVRILFGFLLLVALATWIMRHGVGESVRWQGAQPTAKRRTIGDDYKELFSRKGLRPIFMLLGVYGLWALFAGMNGFYLPYLLQQFGKLSAAGAIGFQCLYFGLTVVSTVLFYLPLADRINRRLLFAIGGTATLVGAAVLAIFTLNTTVALFYVIITGLAQGAGAQHFFQLWSGEEFPTRLRATSQGFLMGVVRIVLGVWSFLVPVIAAAGFTILAILLCVFLAASTLIGIIWGRDARDTALEDIETTQGWTGATA